MNIIYNDFIIRILKQFVILSYSHESLVIPCAESKDVDQNDPHSPFGTPEPHSFITISPVHLLDRKKIGAFWRIVKRNPPSPILYKNVMATKFLCQFAIWQSGNLYFAIATHSPRILVGWAAHSSSCFPLKNPLSFSPKSFPNTAM